MTHSTAASPADAATLKAINELVVAAAVDLELEDGRSCASIPPWCDRHSSSDRQHAVVGFVRVVTRLVGRLAEALGRRRIKGSGIEHDRHGVGCWNPTDDHEAASGAADRDIS